MNSSNFLTTFFLLKQYKKIRAWNNRLIDVQKYSHDDQESVLRSTREFIISHDDHFSPWHDPLMVLYNNHKMIITIWIIKLAFHSLLKLL